MNRIILARGLSILLVAWLYSLYIHHDMQRMSSEGRDKFLARQTQRFDRVVSTRHPQTIAIIGALIVSIPVLFAYELFVFLASQFLKAAGVGIESSAPPARGKLPFS